MIKVGVVGATGYAGAELVRILSGHPEAEITVLTSRQYAGVPFAKVYPAMTGVILHSCEEFDAASVCDRSDVVFTALPHKLPMEIVPDLIRRGKKVIDLSADYRFSDARLYESAYQPHLSPELLSKTVYGLSEVYADAIGSAQLVGNPGCYPTSTLLPLVPLLENRLVESAGIIVDSKSGVSGAGRSPSLAVHFSEVNESFKAYKVAVHRHEPEIESILSKTAGTAVDITFVPHLVPMTRGMATTIYAGLPEGVAEKDIAACLCDYYAGRKFIRIDCDGRPPDTRNVRGTNCCDIGFVQDPHNRRLILMSVIDNLVKGAAGQAVQNMNLMMGIDETAGLSATPFPV